MGQERRKGNTGVGIERHKPVCIKLGTRIYSVTQKTEPIFYNNYRWNITFKIMNHFIAQL